MKKVLIPIIMICFCLFGIQAQNQTIESPQNQVIVKKITIKNMDGKETRTEQIEVYDAANWKKESLKDKDVQVIIKDAEKLTEERENVMIIDKDQSNTHWREELSDDEETPATSPNKAVLGVQLNNVEGNNGAQIIEVFEGSAAEKAGLQEDDILLSVNGKETTNVEAVIKALSDSKPGDKVKVSYLRKTKIKDLKVTLQERKEEMVSMKNCNPSCMSKMKHCNMEDMTKCMKKGMGMNDKVHERIEKEMEQNLDGAKMQRRKQSGEDKMEKLEKINQEAIEEVVRNNEKQYLNLEYLTSSPNPSNGQMKINFSGLPVATTIQVLDLNGKEVYHERIENFDGSYNKDIDIHNESKGTLILKIIQGDTVMTQKIIVE